MMPEQFTEMLTSVLEVGIDTLFISNDNESIYNPFVRRTHCMVTCTFLKQEIKRKEKKQIRKKKKRK